MNLVTIFMIIAGMLSAPNDRLNLLVDTLFTQHEINFGINQYEIYRKDHNPVWKGNFEGGGVYIYEKYSIYFNNIVGSYDDIFIDQISRDTYPKRIVFNNSSQDNNDMIFMIKCFGKGKIKKQENIDDEYYRKETHEYTTDKYKVIFVIDNGRILNMDIRKR